jgi:hypothetical protein
LAYSQGGWCMTLRVWFRAREGGARLNGVPRRAVPLIWFMGDGRGDGGRWKGMEGDGRAMEMHRTRLSQGWQAVLGVVSCRVVPCSNRRAHPLDQRY